MWIGATRSRPWLSLASSPKLVLQGSAVEPRRSGLAVRDLGPATPPVWGPCLPLCKMGAKLGALRLVRNAPSGSRVRCGNTAAGGGCQGPQPRRQVGPARGTLSLLSVGSRVLLGQQGCRESRKDPSHMGVS